MTGSCQDHDRVMTGSCQGHARVMTGSCQDHDRIISEIPINVYARHPEGPFLFSLKFCSLNVEGTSDSLQN